MPRKSIATPTLTESRAKRTPKPNPKYAIDFVAKIRISPDRRTEEEDEDEKVSKRRSNEDSSPDASQLSKSAKKKVKSTPVVESKKPQSKILTPTMSRLSSLRNVAKRISPVNQTKSSPSGSKTATVSSTTSPVLSSAKVSSPTSKKSSAEQDNLEASPSSVASGKRTTLSSGKLELVEAQKPNSIEKSTKKGEKLVSDEIRIVNINDIMKQSETKRKSSEEVKSVKKQKLDDNEIDIIDVEEEISVSSALVRPTTRQRSNVIDKSKPDIKTAQLPSNVQSQLSPLTTGQKKKPIQASPKPLQTKSPSTIMTRVQINKTSGSAKIQENKEELGQVLAKRILRKVGKPTPEKTEVADLKKNTRKEGEKIQMKKPVNLSKIKRITSFEKWSVLNFSQIQPQPARSVLCLSLIKLGNKIKLIKLPSSDWSYRITLQKVNKEYSEKSEVYTGDIEDCGILEGEKGNYAPVNITFERSQSDVKGSPNRSIVFQNKSFAIFMDGKTCKLIGAPQYIYDLIEVQTLLHIVDQVDPFHAYVEQGEK